ncbi:MAG: NUDIX domain-containing protein [Bacteroidales bacterium]|nr:NUDIX domain-containing protein [Bacteroidales bacterium]
MERIFLENRTLLFFPSFQETETPLFQILPHEVLQWAIPELRDYLNRFPQHATLGIDCDTDEKSVFCRFISRFPVIEAAGGLVSAPDERTGGKRYLYIFRNQMWDLPKGKKEAGETDEENALREVAEETGLQNLRITGFLDTTYHFFSDFEKKLCIKKSNWFDMETDRMQATVPQGEEGITQACWLSYNEIKEKFPAMYASIAYLSNRFFAAHAEL